MIKVLDKGYINLVDSMGSDQRVVDAARVSFDGKGKSSNARLINYLWRNGHVSPFEHVFLSIEVKAPIFVMRHIMRHKWFFNEVSGRYVRFNVQFYIPDHTRVNDQENKQASTIDLDSENSWEDVEAAFDLLGRLYAKKLAAGVAKEQARTILPTALYTRALCTANLRSLLHFLAARKSRDAQWETQQYARAIDGIVKEKFPLSWEAAQCPKK